MSERFTIKTDLFTPEQSLPFSALEATISHISRLQVQRSEAQIRDLLTEYFGPDFINRHPMDILDGVKCAGLILEQRSWPCGRAELVLYRGPALKIGETLPEDRIVASLGLRAYQPTTTKLPTPCQHP